MTCQAYLQGNIVIAVNPTNRTRYVLARCAIAAYAEDVATIGGNVRRLREQAGIATQTKLAELMSIPQSRASDLENDRYKYPELQTLIAAATAIGCRIDDLLAGVDANYDARKDNTPADPAPPIRRSTIRRIVRLLEQMTDEGQRLVAQNVALLVPAFRRDGPRAPIERSPDTPSETKRKGRGAR